MDGNNIGMAVNGSVPCVRDSFVISIHENFGAERIAKRIGKFMVPPVTIAMSAG
jgi:hypothetical protein